MKRSEFNPLQRELARGRHGGPHPDSGLLTALAEGALLERERQQVLAHLAACAYCREILSVAAEAAPDSAAGLKPFLLPRRALPPQRIWLPWASIAAGVIVVCSAGLLYQQKYAHQKGTAAATNEAAQRPAPALQQSPPPTLEQAQRLGKTANPPAMKQLQAPPQSKVTMVANSMLEVQSESAKLSPVGRLNSDQPFNATAGEVSAPSPSALKAAPPGATAAFANADSERALSAMSITSAARPHWHINSMGQPEHSLSDGSWQPVLPQEQSKMRVISVFEDEVWIGGEHSRLYHSTDEGATWNLVALPSKDGRDHSIAHIHFQTAQSGSVESDDGIAWTTSNGGVTWR